MQLLGHSNTQRRLLLLRPTAGSSFNKQRAACSIPLQVGVDGSAACRATASSTAATAACATTTTNSSSTGTNPGAVQRQAVPQGPRKGPPVLRRGLPRLLLAQPTSRGRNTPAPSVQQDLSADSSGGEVAAGPGSSSTDRSSPDALADAAAAAAAPTAPTTSSSQQTSDSAAGAPLAGEPAAAAAAAQQQPDSAAAKVVVRQAAPTGPPRRRVGPRFPGMKPRSMAIKVPQAAANTTAAVAETATAAAGAAAAAAPLAPLQQAASQSQLQQSEQLGAVAALQQAQPVQQQSVQQHQPQQQQQQPPRRPSSPFGPRAMPPRRGLQQRQPQPEQQPLQQPAHTPADTGADTAISAANNTDAAAADTKTVPVPDRLAIARAAMQAGLQADASRWQLDDQLQIGSSIGATPISSSSAAAAADTAAAGNSDAAVVGGPVAASNSSSSADVADGNGVAANSSTSTSPNSNDNTHSSSSSSTTLEAVIESNGPPSSSSSSISTNGSRSSSSANFGSSTNSSDSTSSNGSTSSSTGSTTSSSSALGRPRTRPPRRSRTVYVQEAATPLPAVAANAAVTAPAAEGIKSNTPAVGTTPAVAAAVAQLEAEAAPVVAPALADAAASATAAVAAAPSACAAVAAASQAATPAAVATAPVQAHNTPQAAPAAGSKAANNKVDAWSSLAHLGASMLQQQPIKAQGPVHQQASVQAASLAVTVASPTHAETAAEAVASEAEAAAAAETAAQADAEAAAAAEATAPEAAPAAAAGRRRVKSSTSGAGNTGGGTGLSASAVGQLLAGQRQLSVPKTKRAAGAAAGSKTGGATPGSSMAAPGEIVHVRGSWTLAGFDADQRAMDTLLPALQKRLTAGVEAEQAHEQEAMRRLYAASSLRQLQKDGIVLLQLQATPSHVLYSSMVWRFSVAGRAGATLPYHRFRQGDSLLVSRFCEEQLVQVSEANSRRHGINRASVDGSNDLRPGSNGFRPLDATVVEVRKDHLLLALEKGDSDRISQEVHMAAAAPQLSWRLDQSVRDTTARRQLEAIKRLSCPTTNSPFEALLRMVLVGTDNGAYGASVPPEWARDATWRQDVKQLLEKTQGLNNSQRRAIALAVLRSFTLWQGPPGTGKTRTLLALVEVLVKTAQKDSRRWDAMGPILACGDTNAAVDNLVEGLLNKGLRVVRLGQPAKVRPHLQQYTLEALAEQTPQGRKAVQLRQDSKALFEQAKQMAEGTLLSWSNKQRSKTQDLTRSSRTKGSSSSGSKGSRPSQPPSVAAGSSEALDKEARRKWAEAERLSKQAAQQVLQEAQVVCATCSGAGDPLLNELHFNMVVIDEATQATEPATLVPLTQGARCVVMAGDPAQLPPTVTSMEAAQQHGLTVTLFERLQKSLGLEPLLLDTQYRMHPAISAFPSHRFYKGKLMDGVTAEQKPAAAGLAWPQPEQPVMVLAVQGVEEQAKKGKGKAADGSDLLVYSQDAAGGLVESSYRNLQEARVALQAVYALLTAGDAHTAAVLTPYKGQVRALEHALRVLSPWFDSELMSRITVSSVDGYQGREADVVLFSAVRCNKQGRIGFVKDRRRLNVAITRPRRGLVVVCSPETLQKGSADWDDFLTWSEERGWVTDPQQLPAAPWQLEGVDPFSSAAAEGSSSAPSSLSSWSSVEDLS